MGDEDNKPGEATESDQNSDINEELSELKKDIEDISKLDWMNDEDKKSDG